MIDLARSIRHPVADVGVWLRATAALCRLVREQPWEPEDETEEQIDLVARLFKLHWGWRPLPEEEVNSETLREEAKILWQELGASCIANRAESYEFFQ